MTQKKEMQIKRDIEKERDMDRYGEGKKTVWEGFKGYHNECWFNYALFKS